MGSCAAPETSTLRTTRSSDLVTRSCPNGLGPALAGTGGSASRVRLRLARELLILKKRFREGSRLDRPARGRLRSPSVAISQARYCFSLRLFHKVEIARQSASARSVSAVRRLLRRFLRDGRLRWYEP